MKEKRAEERKGEREREGEIQILKGAEGTETQKPTSVLTDPETMWNHAKGPCRGRVNRFGEREDL